MGILWRGLALAVVVGLSCELGVQALPTSQPHGPRPATRHATGLARRGQLTKMGAGGVTGEGKGGARLSLRGGAPVTTLHIDWVSVFGNLFGGLALFLYGMERLGVGLKNAYGEELRGVLLMLSKNRVIGFITGLIACGITNSLSLISVLLVEFVSSDLIPLDNCMGILLGACVGSTLICFLVVLKVTRLGLGMVFLGFITNAMAPRYRTKQLGVAVFGCGIIFFSMDLMSSAFGFMRTHSGFLNLLTRMDNPALGILVSTLVTGLIQSSGATMSILLSLAGQGMLTIKSSAGLMLGANVGTCVTGMLASIGQPTDGVRLAVALLLFRAAGVILLYPFLPVFIKFVCMLCKIDSTKKSTPADVTLFLAWSHTCFNLVLSMGALPFTHLWTDFIRYLIPRKASKKEAPPSKKAPPAEEAPELPEHIVGISTCSNCALLSEKEKEKLEKENERLEKEREKHDKKK